MPSPHSDPLLPKLAALISKAKLFSSAFAHLDVRVYQDDANKGIFFIEVFKDRCSRRVLINARTAENVRNGLTDVILLREVRSALQFVATQSKELEAKAARVAARRR
jgi:hypothetical protein